MLTFGETLDGYLGKGLVGKKNAMEHEWYRSVHILTGCFSTDFEPSFLNITHPIKKRIRRLIVSSLMRLELDLYETTIGKLPHFRPNEHHIWRYFWSRMPRPWLSLVLVKSHGF